MKINTYEKLPVRVKAMKFDGSAESVEAVKNFIGYSYSGQHKNPIKVKIKTLEGEHIASPGDYIIKGIKGEFYPCKPDIFEKLYRIVND